MTDRINKLIESLLDQAVDAAKKSDWQTVARVCSEAIELDPVNPEAARMLEVANSRLKAANPVTIINSLPPTYRDRYELLSDYTGLVVRMNWAKYTVGVTVVLLVVSFFTTLSEISLIDDLENFVPGAQDRVDDNDNRQALVSLLYLAAYISSVVSFLIWLKAAYSNLPLIGKVATSFSTGWVVGWWFVPIASLFKPYQIMKELWWGSYTDGNRAKDSRNVWPLLGWFWGAHLVGNMVAWSSFRAGTGDLESIRSGDYMFLVSTAFLVAAGILLFLFVDKVSISQQFWIDAEIEMETSRSNQS